MAAKEKAQQAENEIARKKYEKETIKAKEINDERLHKLAIEAKMREKKELEERVKEQRRRYELDMKERFGDAWESKVPQKKEKEELKGEDLAKNGIQTVATVYTEARSPGVAQTCFKTCLTLVGNLMKEPGNEKFRRVNLENNAIKQRISTIQGGLNILKGAGFRKSDDGTQLVIDQSEINQLQLSQVVRLL